MEEAGIRLKPMHDYTQRDRVLVRLGFPTYRDYLESELWHRIRASVLRKSSGMCCVCGCEATQVHHKCYDKNTLLGKTNHNLVSICETCHKLIEFDSRKRKRKLKEANAVLKRLRRNNASVTSKKETKPSSICLKKQPLAREKRGRKSKRPVVVNKRLTIQGDTSKPLSRFFPKNDHRTLVREVPLLNTSTAWEHQVSEE